MVEALAGLTPLGEGARDPRFPEISVQISGKDVPGWTRVKVRRSIEELCGTIELELDEGAAPAGFSLVIGTSRPPVDRLPALKLGLPLKVLANKAVVMEALIDDIDRSYDRETRHTVIQAREPAADLVDCTASANKNGTRVREWSKGANLQTVAQALCQPFGIKIDVFPSKQMLPAQFDVQGDETVFHALEKLAAMRGLIFWPNDPPPPGYRQAFFLASPPSLKSKDPSAGAILKTVLERGVNISEGRAKLGARRRFSHYFVGVHGQGMEDDGLTLRVRASAQDPGVGRFRPLWQGAEDDHSSAEDCLLRARWEASVRLGRAVRFEIAVPGWAHSQGLWKPLSFVKVKDDWLGLDTALLICGVSLERNDRGTRAMLELSPDQAFQPEPLKAGKPSILDV